MTPNPTTTAPTTEEWMRLAIEELHAYFEHVRSDSLAVPDSDHSESILARHYAAAHPAGTEEQPKKGLDDLKFGLSGRLNNFGEFVSTAQIGLNGEPKTVRIRVCGKDKDAVNQMAQRLALTDTKLSNAWSNNDHYRAEIASLTTALAEAKSRCAELEKTNKELQEVCDLVGSQLEASAQDCIDETQHREQIEKNCLQAFDLSQQWQKDCELAKARAETAEAQCDRMKAALEECQRILEDEAPELNITNYDDSQAYDLNEAANKVYGVIRAALSTPPAEEKPS